MRTTSLSQNERQPSQADRGHLRSRGITLVEMLVVVALTVLLMSIVTEVLVLASGTLRQLHALTEVHQKLRTAESVIRLDLENRTIREVQPPFERKAGADGIFGPDEVESAPGCRVGCLIQARNRLAECCFGCAGSSCGIGARQSKAKGGERASRPPLENSRWAWISKPRLHLQAR